MITLGLSIVTALLAFRMLWEDIGPRPTTPGQDAADSDDMAGGGL